MACRWSRCRGSAAVCRRAARSGRLRRAGHLRLGHRPEGRQPGVDRERSRLEVPGSRRAEVLVGLHRGGGLRVHDSAVLAAGCGLLDRQRGGEAPGCAPVSAGWFDADAALVDVDVSVGWASPQMVAARRWFPASFFRWSARRRSARAAGRRRRRGWRGGHHRQPRAPRVRRWPLPNPDQPTRASPDR